MDPSALIFVALAVAWAVYLVPKALEHHDESLRSRTISTFSHTMRVLARREPVTGRTTRLVAGAPAPAAPAPVVAATSAKPATAAKTAKAGKAAKRRRSAAARRRNVLILLVLATAAVAGAAGMSFMSWVWVAAPLVVLAAWLVACRLMVRRERAVRRSASPRSSTERAASSRQSAPPASAEQTASAEDAGAVVAGAVVLDDDTTDIPAVATGRWDPVDVPLPTYVSKPPAVRRTVRTIDLDSTGVWSSGRSEVDSALAREADAARRDAREDQAERRATGS